MTTIARRLSSRPRLRQPIHRSDIGRFAIVALGIWTLTLSVAYLTKAAAVARYRVESAACIFLVAGVLWSFWHHRDEPVDRGADHQAADSWWMWCAAAVLLYAPALSVGLLSDDFVLANRATHWNLHAFNEGGFRPVPLLLWSLILSVGAGPAALHLLNVVVHGTNAWLASRLARGSVAWRGAASSAGVMVLTAPVSVEPVVWGSGVFDLVATALVLCCVWVARGYGEHPGLGRRLTFVAMAAGAILSKETAAVAGILVLMDGWRRRSLSRPLTVDALIVSGLSAVYATVRIAAAWSDVRRPLTRYLLQRDLFGAFGSLAIPFHVDVISRVPALAVIDAVVVVGLLTVFFVARPAIDRIRAAAAGAAWVLLAICPMATFFYVAPDLEGARYLYLPVVGWAGVMLSLADNGNRRPHGPFLAAVVLAATWLIGVRLELAPWVSAAATRDSVIRAVQSDPRVVRCGVIHVNNLPDTVQGAYVFRNGAPEAFARAGIQFVREQAGRGCDFEWAGFHIE